MKNKTFYQPEEALTKWYIANFIFHPKFISSKKKESWGCLQMKTTEVDGNKLNGYERETARNSLSVMEWRAFACEMRKVSSVISPLCKLPTYTYDSKLLSSFARFACHKSFFCCFLSRYVCCMHFVFITFSSNHNHLISYRSKTAY